MNPDFPILPHLLCHLRLFLLVLRWGVARVALAVCVRSTSVEVSLPAASTRSLPGREVQILMRT